ncbi:MAG: sigma-54-dependent Fis family transcriptional regulator [Ignavibacteriaceae bacterium]|jgi:DNA-binding NtrC family response regulator|nr:MAG: sigma-54-dependent Fis family transcriptional regulator [Chlorobiota bacterium]MBE7475666.1 sigma-54-dependent Fis family transcriptional regulator [Ignavibacteriales bacterium]MCC7093034.1 sigma-54-dependent Fis family transcriptional regulator [Ignavibacteriaceae bacterium]MCE7856042.1 sigma-54-dependent Fis family transcriptional regulator [Ignavibacteria bacterium CHB3]MEB2295102.1 sigma-54 dependent transcriptional regulator [Ignavibacteria bacterium]GIK59222.1 MAG: sigma-54-depen
MASLKNSKILVCDDDETLCYLLKEQLLEEGFEVDAVYDGKYAIESIKRSNYDILLLDLNMKEVQGEEVLKFVKDYNASLQVIILSAQGEMRKAIECIKSGAYDFITKPYEFDDLMLTVGRALEHKDLLVKTEILTKEISKKGSENIVGNSAQLKRVLNLANKAAISDSNILIEGETGTGKELLAEYIHKHSARKDKPFVVINCASLPDQLIESELFGHEKGAFTDAKNTKQGLVEIAHGGTLFLDEIGELSLSLQPKLLRFLENGEYRRIGGITTLTSHVRVIGATNRNLLEEADNKNFRKDLLFRLNVITLTIPPLRDRKEDILLLANYFIKEKSPIRSPKHLSQEAEDMLISYSFNGNIRELEHIIERALIFAEGDVIYPEDLNLPQSYQTPTRKHTDIEHAEEILSMEELERWHIKKVLDKNRWDRTQTANQLGISPKTLYTKIKKYELKPV